MGAKNYSRVALLLLVVAVITIARIATNSYSQDIIIPLIGNGTNSTTIATTISTTTSTTSSSTTTSTLATSSSTSTSTTSTTVGTTTTVPAMIITVTANGTLTNTAMYGVTPLSLEAFVNGAPASDYSFDWQLNGQDISGAVGTGPSITFPLPSAGTYNFEAVATNNGNTLDASNTVTITQNNTISAFDNNPGIVQYNTSVLINFTPQMSINNQLQWALMVNGNLVQNSTSSILWSEQEQPGLYNFVFFTSGDANYTSYSIPESLYVQSPSTSTTPGGGSTSIVTTSTTSTTTSTSVGSTSSTIPSNVVTIKKTAPYDVLVNYSYAVAPPNPTIVYVLKANTIIYISAISPTIANVTATNITNSISSFPGYNTIVALNLSIHIPVKGSSSILTQYPCSLQSNSIAPYYLANTGWKEFDNYTIDPSTCTIKFGMPSNPIIGIFEFTADVNSSGKPINDPVLQSPSNSSTPSNTVVGKDPANSLNVTKMLFSPFVSPVKSLDQSQIAAILISLVIIGVIVYISRQAP